PCTESLSDLSTTLARARPPCFSSLPRDFEGSSCSIPTTGPPTWSRNSSAWIALISLISFLPACSPFPSSPPPARAFCFDVDLSLGGELDVRMDRRQETEWSIRLWSV